MNTANYVQKIAALYAAGHATEHSYRGDLQNYLEALLPDVKATNEPKRQKCGAPDYVITKTRKSQPIDIGYIEAKDINAGLDTVEKSEQMKRYLASLDNLILTDYLEFRFFRSGEKVATVRIAEVDDFFTQDIKIKPLPDQFAALESQLANFVEYVGQTIKSPKMLAQMMARKAQLMRDVFYNAVTDTEEQSSLKDQLNAFRQVLIHDMDEKQFADVYAQTIAYGLFTARLHDQTLEDFSRQEARELIPRSNPFLRNLFDYVCGADIDHRVVWIIDALCEVYRATNIRDILKEFGRQSGRNDPVVHFYETFLAEYDPKLRKARGVWYTPEPVVNFIVRAVDEVLQTHFGLPDGLADTSKVTIEVEDQSFDKRTKTGKAKKKIDVHKVQLLDVAAGTGTFTAEAIKQIHACFAGMEGMWSSYVEQDLLPRLHGFEILMASYAMCHLKIDLLLTELGYKPSNPNNPPRLGVYLTNALEEYHPDEGTLFASWLSREANEASRIKRDMPIMVAYGNPPYSGESTNKGEHIMELMQAYKQEPSGGKLQEKNSKWLNDDYVKFIRLAENYIERNGEGVLAFITNHGYLDNPTFRGMRWHLLSTFDDIYIIDLHGNAKKKEVSPDGSVDKNVFDIQAGVAIIIAAKHKKTQSRVAQIHHLDIWGSRQAKYQTLWQSEIKALPFTKLQPTAPNYFFVPYDEEASKRYKEYFSVNILFAVNSVGIVTARDSLTIHETKEKLHQTIENFSVLPVEEAREKYCLDKDAADWKIALAQKDLLESNLSEKYLSGIAYRPFDNRYTYYTGKSKGFHCRPRGQVMRHMAKENLGLAIGRQGQVVGSMQWNLVSMIQGVADFNYFYRGGILVHPLYLYPDEDAAQGSLDDAAPSPKGRGGRRPNLDEKIVAEISQKLDLPFIPDHDPEYLSPQHLSLWEKSASESAPGEGNANVPTPSPQPSPKGRAAFTPLDLLDYIYAVLHSPSYRETYKEFLKIDFPRVPYPDDADTFWQLVALGSELRQLHLLEHSALGKSPVTFPEQGTQEVGTIGKQSYRQERVYINDTQYFGNVPEVAWSFYIGGYQPAQKWLKDRKGRALTFDDIRHYQKIIVALTETDRLMKAIDDVWKP